MNASRFLTRPMKSGARTIGTSFVAIASTKATDASWVRRRDSQKAAATIHKAATASMCPLWAISNTTSGFQAYASVSHSERPVAASHRHSTTIVSRSQATSASFMASVESLIMTTRRKKSCAAGGYGVRSRRLGMRAV